MSIIFRLYKVKIPLIKPYHLSFGRLDFFNSIIVNLQDDDRHIYSESTALFGYSWESIHDMWQHVSSWINSSKGSLRHLVDILEVHKLSFPFSVCSLLVCVEKYVKKDLFVDKNTIPVVGVISDDDLGVVEREAYRLIDDGFKVIKIKIKGVVDKDIEKINKIGEIVNNDIRLRIDANQSYKLDSIKRLINKLNLEKIEYLEQPFKRDAWSDLPKLARISPVEIMLDESIWNAEDIINASKIKNVTHVKLKLFKHGCIKKTVELIELAKKLGLKVILGNGVQSEIGCLDEAIIYKLSYLDTVAEFNGFLKQRISPLNLPIEIKNGKVVVDKYLDTDDSRLYELSDSRLEAIFDNDLKIDRSEIC